MTDEACANCGHGLDAHGDSHYCAMFLAEYPEVKALRDRIAVLEGALGTIANHDLVGASTQYLALQSIARAALDAAGGK